MNLNRLSEGMILEILDTLPSRKLYKLACTSQWMWDLVGRMKPRANDLDFLVLRYFVNRSEANMIAFMQFPNSFRRTHHVLQNLFKESKYYDVWCLEYYLPELKWMEEEEGLTAIKISMAQSGHLLAFVSSDIQGNIDLVKLAVTRHGFALKYASEELKNNMEVVKLAVAENGQALQYASEGLRGNIEVVKIAVAQDGYALQFTSNELKGNSEVVKIAKWQNGFGLR